METVYEYVKGKGWVLSPTHYTMVYRGNTYRFYNRRPVVGERYVFVPDRDFSLYKREDGSMDIQKILERLSSLYYIKSKGEHHHFNDKGYYITAVKL